MSDDSDIDDSESDDSESDDSDIDDSESDDRKSDDSESEDSKGNDTADSDDLPQEVPGCCLNFGSGGRSQARDHTGANHQRQVHATKLTPGTVRLNWRQVLCN